MHEKLGNKNNVCNYFFPLLFSDKKCFSIANLKNLKNCSRKIIKIKIYVYYHSYIAFVVLVLARQPKFANLNEKKMAKCPLCCSFIFIFWQTFSICGKTGKNKKSWRIFSILDKKLVFLFSFYSCDLVKLYARAFFLFLGY